MITNKLLIRANEIWNFIQINQKSNFKWMKLKKQKKNYNFISLFIKKINQTKENRCKFIRSLLLSIAAFACEYQNPLCWRMKIAQLYLVWCCEIFKQINTTVKSTLKQGSGTNLCIFVISIKSYKFNKKKKKK